MLPFIAGGDGLSPPAATPTAASVLRLLSDLFTWVVIRAILRRL